MGKSNREVKDQEIRPEDRPDGVQPNGMRWYDKATGKMFSNEEQYKNWLKSDSRKALVDEKERLDVISQGRKSDLKNSLAMPGRDATMFTSPGTLLTNPSRGLFGGTILTSNATDKGGILK